MKLEGKVAIVTGGGQGIGEGIVLCLAEEGADVAVFDINRESTDGVVDAVKSMGRKALPVIADLTDEGQLNRGVQETLDFFGRIDILVNNVGGTGKEMLDKLMKSFVESSGEGDPLPEYMLFSSEDWDKTYKLNLRVHAMMCNAVTPHFVKQRSGKIVNVSSIGGRLPAPTEMPYAACKAGEISITWSVASALASYNVNVNCICPGLVYTPLWETMAEGYVKMIQETKAKGGQLPGRFAPLMNVDMEGMTGEQFFQNFMVGSPLRRAQSVEDMGRAVVFLVSEDARNITGQTLHIDGGVTMR
ncbi:MAG: SDR family oxidoreductase [Proteobacteria bacterium]|nr:SDR family oxidoreductase [Pseudomonadota bacterium]